MNEQLTYAGVAIFGKGKTAEDIIFRSSTTTDKTEPLQAYIALPDSEHVSTVTHKIVKLPRKMDKQEAMRYLLTEAKGFLTPAIREYLQSRIRSHRRHVADEIRQGAARSKPRTGSSRLRKAA